MSVRGLSFFVTALALFLVVSCGGESPLTPATDEMLAADGSSDVMSVALSPQAAKQVKVTICHIPPGNPANAHDITVAESALPAHYAHGDTLGSCSTEPPPPEECSGACSTLTDDEVCCELRADCDFEWDELENRFCVAI